MTSPIVLAIDQGTTNTKALIVSANGQVLAKASVANQVSHPKSGWAEQSPDALWEGVQVAIAEAAHGFDVSAIAISNQRESVIAWDAESGAAISPCISWQCRRSQDLCRKIIADGHGEDIEQRTGLAVDPMFPATKMKWILDSIPVARTLVERGKLRIGTVDSWLLWKLTGHQVHATDHSNASRTQLYNTQDLQWDVTIADLLGVPISALPDVKVSSGIFGFTAADTTALPAGVPIHAMIGDSHAALYGHGIRHPGAVKATYGTGSSLMTPVAQRVLSANGLSSTIAWSNADGITYALEGNISVSGQGVAFIGSILGLPGIEDLTQLASSVPDSAGVCFVPALGGLGAPYWDGSARGLITGMSFDTTAAQLARAAIEAVGFQVWAVFDAMEQDLNTNLQKLHADGGASENAMLMQWQADILGRPVAVSSMPEVSALGAAALAFEGLGRPWTFADEENSILPAMTASQRAQHLGRWRRAIVQCTSGNTVAV